MKIKNTKSARRFPIFLYVSLIALSIFLSPRKSDHIEEISEFFDWIPAFRNLLEISTFPAKTTIWLGASIALSPLAWIYCFSITKEQEPSSEENKKKSLIGILIIATLITPFLLVESYRTGMSRSGFIIGFLSKSEWLLLVYGPLISLIYSLIYSMIFSLSYRLLKHQKT